jgi:hypothetical protein
MRKILTFASLVLLGSVVGCEHANSGCSSCGCGSSALSSTGNRPPFTVGVCDCYIPPLAPYGRSVGTGPVAAQQSDAPQIMPQAQVKNVAPAN